MIIQFEQDGATKQVDIPFALKERTFENFCDFRTKEALYLEHVENNTIDEPIDLAERATLLEHALQEMAWGDLDAMPISEVGDDINELIKNRYQIRPGDNMSIFRVYAHLVVLIQSYEPKAIPKSFHFKYRNKDFVVRREETAKVLRQRALTTGEAIEVLEYQRLASMRMENEPREVGNIDFNLGLEEFAILVRQKGERLPVSRSERERFIEKRKRLFRNLDLETLMALRFFFISALIDSAITPGFSSFGKAQLPPRTPNLISKIQQIGLGKLWGGRSTTRSGRKMDGFKQPGKHP